MVLRAFKGSEGAYPLSADVYKEWVDKHEHFELMAPVNLSVVCFRLNDARSEEKLDKLNQEFLENLNATGKVFLTHTTLRGKYVLRMAIAAGSTEERHVREAWELMVVKAKEMLKS